MDRNKSLSSRIRRRNKQGFSGLGTCKMVMPDGTVRSFNTVRLESGNFGDYNNSEQNDKERDITIAEKRKNKLGFKRVYDMFGKLYSRNKRALTKKYADGHQKLKK